MALYLQNLRNEGRRVLFDAYCDNPEEGTVVLRLQCLPGVEIRDTISLTLNKTTYPITINPIPAGICRVIVKLTGCGQTLESDFMADFTS